MLVIDGFQDHGLEFYREEGLGEFWILLWEGVMVGLEGLGTVHYEQMIGGKKERLE
jgi:hypothetical protein